MIFDEVLSELQDVFSSFREILVVILYGSVARGDYSVRHSDMDLLIVLKKSSSKAKIQDKVRGACTRHGVRAHIEFQGIVIRSDDRSLLRKMIEEGKVVYSSGVWLFDNKQIGLRQFIMYSYSTKGSRLASLFSKALHGHKSWYYQGKKKVLREYPGVIDGSDIIFCGKGCLLVVKSKQKDIEMMFERFNVIFSITKILYG